MTSKQSSHPLEKLCKAKKLRLTDQRRIIIRVLSESQDHPDVEVLYKRVKQLSPGISLATIYRTLRLFKETHILNRHDFGDGKARYEEATTSHHHHLIDTETGHIIEFQNEQLEYLQKEIAAQLGYDLVGHRIELYGISLKRIEKKTCLP